MRGKIYFAAVFAAVLLAGLVGFVSAQDLPNYYDKYVNDFTGMMNGNDTSELWALFAGVEADTTAEVVLAVVNTTAPYVPAEYRTKLFEFWKTGKADKDNGLLILYAVQEKRIEVEVGYGLEGILPDSKVGRMLDENYVPLRDAGNVTAGIVAFSKAVAAEIEANREEVLSGQANPAGSSILPIILIVAFFALFVFFIVMAKMKKSDSNKINAKKTAVSRGDVNVHIKHSYNAIGTVLVVAGFIATAAFSYGFFALIAAFIVSSILSSKSVRCARDGLAMRHTGSEGNYAVYECADGHAGKLLKTARHGFFAAGGGMGGGGFGGGGFGGGMSGGGGAGR